MSKRKKKVVEKPYSVWADIGESMVWGLGIFVLMVAFFGLVVFPVAGAYLTLVSNYYYPPKPAPTQVIWSAGGVTTWVHTVDMAEPTQGTNPIDATGIGAGDSTYRAVGK